MEAQVEAEREEENSRQAFRSRSAGTGSWRSASPRARRSSSPRRRRPTPLLRSNGSSGGPIQSQTEPLPVAAGS
ncbi:unnamed protein product [Gadus morhua 'NCC']